MEAGEHKKEGIGADMELRGHSEGRLPKGWSAGGGPFCSNLAAIIGMEPEGVLTCSLVLTILFFVLLLVLQHTIYRRRRQQALDGIRARMGRDFHDELGSRISIITLFSELAKDQIDINPQQARQHLDKVIATSSELYHSMKDLIWSLDPGKDQLGDLWNRLELTGQELLAEAGVDFRFVRSDLPVNALLSFDLRRHILLIVKEAMNNTLKHAQCTEAALHLAVRGQWLHIDFRDNGRGFDLNQQPAGEGLKNMQERAGRIGGKLQIRSDSQGTFIQLLCPLADI